ncbi:hypothetical protein R5R35_010385 [Gryllus longicercus]|uniref:Uncharacterized protein n=1 Tax=Gryllus longicercus TaxID=2509291 RepID=A0AAN9YYS6_9ORTH
MYLFIKLLCTLWKSLYFLLVTTHTHVLAWTRETFPHVVEIQLQINAMCMCVGAILHTKLLKESQEKILIPRLARAFTEVQQVEAGQYCSFIIHTNGTLSACGKGSCGRLGLGDSNNQQQPKHVAIDGVVRKVSSSKGSNGHTLALTDDGNSWGDGYYGGILSGKMVKYIHAGYRHSAAITDEGELYTWGEGDHGRLATGASQTSEDCR